MIIVLVILTLMTACTTTEVTSEEAVLTVGGKEYSSTQLESLGTVSTDYTNQDGETTTYTGVSLTKLLEDARLSSTGTTLIFTAVEGYQADVELLPKLSIVQIASWLLTMAACGWLCLKCQANFRSGTWLKLLFNKQIHPVLMPSSCHLY